MKNMSKYEISIDELDCVVGGSVRVEGGGNVYKKVNGVKTGPTYTADDPAFVSNYVSSHYGEYMNDDAMIAHLLEMGYIH